MKKKVFAMIAAAVGVTMLLTACSKEKEKDTKVPEPEQTPVVEEQRPAKVENDPVQQEQAQVQPDDVIVTAYGELKYPGMWTDRVSHEIEEDGGDVKVHFYSMVDDTQVPLFTLCYGTVADDGYEFGSLMTDGDVAVPVSMVMHPIVPQEGWSEETVNELYDLQESQNDLLVQIQTAPNFIA